MNDLGLLVIQKMSLASDKMSLISSMINMYNH